MSERDAPTRFEARGLALEVLELLYSTYLVKHHSTGADDPVEAMRSLKLLQLLVDDILLRLAKLRDSDSRSLACPEALRVLRRSPGRAETAKRVAAQLTEYERLTAPVWELRNARIAHFAKRDISQLEPPLQMYDAVRLAVEITDAILGERCSYEVAGLDLRRELWGNDAA